MRVADDDVGGLTEVGGALVGHDGDADNEIEAVQAAEGVEIGGVVPRVQRPSQLSLLQQCTHGRALVRIDRRADLQHLAAPARPQSGRDRPVGDAAQLRDRRLLVLGRTEVKGDGQALQFGRPVD